MTPREFEIIHLSLLSRLSAIVRQFEKAASLPMDEDDIVQEAFIALWQLSEKGYPIRNPEALLVRITKNICIGQYRKGKNMVRTELEDTMAGAETASSGVEAADDERIKRLLYETLSKTEREYMILKTEEGMSLDQIAQTTGKDKPGIKTALSKARKKLMEAFKNNGYDE